MMGTEVDLKKLSRIAAELRYDLVCMSHRAETPHLGGSLSCVDILVALYWSALNINAKDAESPSRDRFILSKGHAATTLYAALCKKGFFPTAVLDSYAKAGSVLAEHPGPKCVPGMEAATGSLGHGLSMGIGMALGGRLNKLAYKVFVLLSDGECQEGSVWEAAMFAPMHKLENLIAIIDYNKCRIVKLITAVISGGYLI